jgi:hypothetical protein
MRSLIVGDSIATTLAPSLAYAAQLLSEQTGVPRAEMQTIAVPGFGFTSSLPGVYDGRLQPGFDVFRDWTGTIDAAIAKDDPDVVVVLVGSWDMVRRVVDDRLVGPADCAWTPWYRAMVETALQHLTARGARVLWLAFPCTTQEENVDHFTLNHLLRSVAAEHHDAMAYVDLDGYVCPDGVPVHSMRAPDGSLRAVRGGDDTHFDFYQAGYVLGPWFAQQFRALLNLAP